jgi:hypothetical protein
VTDDATILEQMMTGTVIIGETLGLPGHGRRISFCILHVFEVRDGLINRDHCPTSLTTGRPLAPEDATSRELAHRR